MWKKMQEKTMVYKVEVEFKTAKQVQPLHLSQSNAPHEVPLFQLNQLFFSFPYHLIFILQFFILLFSKNIGINFWICIIL